MRLFKKKKYFFFSSKFFFSMLIFVKIILDRHFLENLSFFLEKTKGLEKRFSSPAHCPAKM